MFRILGKSKIAFVLAILFGISLFFFKGGSRYSNFFNSDNVVANVSGTPISTTKFNRTLRMNLENFGQMFGKQITGDEIKNFGIHNLAMGALINDAIFENEYDNINLKIDEKVIALKTKERIPQLYDQNNKLNQQYLNSFLQQQQLKIEDIVQIINYETRNGFLNDALFRINYPSFFSNKINSYDLHEREISYIVMPLADFNIDKKLKEYSNNLKEELNKYFEKNIDNYMTKEKRDVEYIIINKTLLNSNFIPSDYEIQEYYNSNKNLYLENEKRSFVQFNFKNIKDAEDFKLKINSYNLSEVINYAKENNIQFNEFKELTSNDVLEEIAEPLFNLNINEQSKIIETSLAKHVIVLKSILPSKQLNLSDIKENIKESIIKIETDNYYNDLNDQISDLILNGSNLKEIANKFNFKLENIPNLTIDYIDNNKEKDSIIRKMKPAIFMANKDFTSDIKKFDEDISFIFNVKNVIESVPEDFENVENLVSKDWKNSKKIDFILEEMNLNKNIVNDLSNKYNINIENIVLNTKSDELPKKFIQNIFKSEKEENANFIDEDLFYIARLNNIIISENINIDSKIEILDDLRSSFGSELGKNKKISINENLINAIINQY